MRGNQENQQFKKSEKNELVQYLSIFFILLLIAISEVKAQDQTSEMKMEEVALAAPSEKKFTLHLTLEHASDLKAKANPDRDESTSLIFEPEYKFSKKTSIAGRVDAVQNHDSERRTGLTNSVVVLTPTKIDLSTELIFKPNISVTLPTDSLMVDNESFQGTVSLRPTLEYTVSSKLLLVNVLYLNRNFHEYKIKRDFSANSEYSVRNRIAAAYAFTDDLTLEVVNDYVRLWSYNGYAKDTFYFAQELKYQFVKDWSVRVSHKNEGSARGPNNNGENVEIADTKSSYIALGLSHVF